MAFQSSGRDFPVFISHAGEDKATIATPLRKMLRELGIPAFVDENDIRPGCDATDEMTSALESAKVAVIVLSPEFVAKKWPMKELLFFLNRRNNSQANGEPIPVIIPVFYRLSVQDMYSEPRFERKDADGKSLYRKTRFFERCDNEEPEADADVIRSALTALHGVMGLENKYGASNEASSLPSRLLLLKDICATILQVMTEQVGEKHYGKNEDGSSKPCEASMFRPRFHSEPLHDVFLDFERTGPDGKALTLEGNIKNRILKRQRGSEAVFAIHGIGGVGKSTILKALTNEMDLRERFEDGIYLMSLGMEATVGTLLWELHRVLGDTGAAVRHSGAVKIDEKGRVMTEEIRAAMRDVVSWFQGKRCAFLIDDVWTNGITGDMFSQVLRGLESAGPDIVIVFSTRERDVASVAHMKSMFHVIPREVQGCLSTKIIFNHAGIAQNAAVDDSTKPIIKEVLEICSGLPVSLAAAGKGVKMLRVDMDTHDAWKEYLMMIRNYRAHLLRENVAGYGNLYITFGASLSLLQEGLKEKLGFKTPASFGQMHRRLCVLQKQERVPAGMLMNLWELENETEAKIVGTLFVRVGLAECRYGRYEGMTRSWRLSMHDSLHDYATSEATRHEGVMRAHGILLDGYNRPRADLLSQQEGQTEWSCFMRNDGYILQNLCRHLCEAGRATEIGSLILFLQAVFSGEKRIRRAKRAHLTPQQSNLHTAELRRSIRELYIQALELHITHLEEECVRIIARMFDEKAGISALTQVITDFEKRLLKRRKKI